MPINPLKIIDDKRTSTRLAKALRWITLFKSSQKVGADSIVFKRKSLSFTTSGNSSRQSRILKITPLHTNKTPFIQAYAKSSKDQAGVSSTQTVAFKQSTDGYYFYIFFGSKWDSAGNINVDVFATVNVDFEMEII